MRHLRNDIRLLLTLGTFMLLAACEKKDVAQAPEPPVKNAFTDYVDRGVTTMDKAKTVTNQANAVIQRQNAQTQNAVESQ